MEDDERFISFLRCWQDGNILNLNNFFLPIDTTVELLKNDFFNNAEANEKEKETEKL